MKTIKTIIVAIALIGLCNAAQAQYGSRVRNGNNGLAMTIGGVSLMIGGFTTRPDRYVGADGVWRPKPFYNQGPRASAIFCGLTLTITGLITSIINK